jgi:hypothetical protein
MRLKLDKINLDKLGNIAGFVNLIGVIIITLGMYRVIDTKYMIVGTACLAIGGGTMGWIAGKTPVEILEELMRLRGLTYDRETRFREFGDRTLEAIQSAKAKHKKSDPNQSLTENNKNADGNRDRSDTGSDGGR